MNAVPGISLQIVLIPVLIITIEKIEKKRVEYKISLFVNGKLADFMWKCAVWCGTIIMRDR